jgi:hypothetical protein
MHPINFALPLIDRHVQFLAFSSTPSSHPSPFGTGSVAILLPELRAPAKRCPFRKWYLISIFLVHVGLPSLLRIFPLRA